MKDKLIVRAIAEDPEYLRQRAAYKPTTQYSKKSQGPVVVYRVNKKLVNEYVEKCCKQRNIPVNNRNKKRKPSFASFGTSIN